MVQFLSKTQATVDAIGPGKVAYQMTISGKHTVNDDGLKHAIELVGATSDDPLRLFIVVPSKVFSTWLAKKDVVPVTSAHRDKVKVYVVRMTEDF
jgi:hypothetical protein